jgi:hypothetical protein
MHCQDFHPWPLNRRGMLTRSTQGFGLAAVVSIFKVVRHVVCHVVCHLRLTH